MKTVPADLAGLAERHGIAGLAWDAVIGIADAPPEVVSALAGSARMTAARHMAALGDLSATGEALDAADLRWLVLKGPVLTESYYGAPHRRGYADVDLVVPGRDLERAVTALETAGGVLLDRNWALLAAEKTGALHVRMPFGTVIDLHWRLLGRARTRFRLNPAGLLERAERTRIGDVEVSVAAPTDLVAFVALDAALAGAHRLVWLADLDRIARAGVDWDDLVSRANAWRATAPIGLILRRTRSVLGAPIPDEVLRDLDPGWVGSADRFLSVPRSGRRALLTRLPGRVAGMRTRKMITTLAVSAWRAARSPGPYEALRPAGDHTDRAAYFEAAAGGEPPTTAP